MGFLNALVEDPLGVLAAIWDGIVQPIKDDWNQGNYGEAVGRGLGTVAATVAGGKGAGKVRSDGGDGGHSPGRSADSSSSGGGNGSHACSFAGETRVLRSDGEAIPIGDAEVGDKVLATDPETGEEGVRPVEKVWVHQDIVFDLVLQDGSTITTTEDHPFYSLTDQEWQRANELDSSDYLKAADGSSIRVVGLDSSKARRVLAYNLTVEDIHTFYVQADSSVQGEGVLVHNTCPPFVPGQAYYHTMQTAKGTVEMLAE